MLVLTRKMSETIQIGDHIVVKVIRTGRTAVKVGIDAPANVRVVRGELLSDARGRLEPQDPLELPAEAIATCSDQFPHPHIV